MKITIVTPCLNAEATLERTINSLQSQQYSSLEYIVCDGGSQDGTLGIIDKYRDFINNYSSEPDNNVAEAVNKGFKRATGEVFGYLNADDCLTPGSLYKVKAIFEANPMVDVVTGGCNRVYADGTNVSTQVPDRYLKILPLRNDIEQPSTFWRSSLYRNAGPFDESYFLAFDWEWWNRIHAKGARFLVTNEVLSVYYFSENNLTSKAGLRGIKEMYKVTKKYGPYGGFVADLYWFLFKTFDMHGYYDVAFESLPPRKQFIFGKSLRLLAYIFGEDITHNYNWNWACRQMRGVKWF